MTSRQRIITKFSETNITVEEIAHEIMLPVPTTLNILHGKDMAELFYDKAYNAIIKLENQPNVVEHPAVSCDDYKKLSWSTQRCRMMTTKSYAAHGLDAYTGLE